MRKLSRYVVPAGLAIVCSIAFAAQTEAVELFGSTLDNRIVRVDSFTGAILGGFDIPAQAGPPNLIAGLTMARGDRELLYTNAGPDDPLVRLDPATGALLGAVDAPNASRGGLSYQSVAGGDDALFVLEDGSPVLRYDGLGGTASQFVFESPDFAGALGGDDHGRSFVAVASASLVEFEPITGAQLHIYSYGFDGGVVTGLAYDRRYVYLSYNGGASVATLDPDAGLVVRTVDVAGGVVLTGLAARGAIPEPMTHTLALIGLAGLCAAARRRSSSRMKVDGR